MPSVGQVMSGTEVRVAPGAPSSTRRSSSRRRCAAIFNALRKAMPKNEKLACFLGGLSAPVLNTVFFMGFLVLIFYNCDYVQNLANTLGAQNAFMFIVLLVGVQAIF